VANVDLSGVSAYTINASTGALAPIDADPGASGVQNVAGGDGPSHVITTGTIQ